MGEVQNFIERAVWSVVGLDDGVLDPHGRIDHWPGRYQAHTPDHRVEPNHLGDITLLLGHRLSEKASSFDDEVAVERLQLGLFGFTMRVAKLRPQRQPR